MAFTLNWNANIDGSGPNYPWAGNITGDALVRISTVIPAGQPGTISLQALPAPMTRGLVISASRYSDVTWALDGQGAVSINGPLILTHDTAQIFNVSPGGSLVVSNTGADDLYVEIGLIRDA